MPTPTDQKIAEFFSKFPTRSYDKGAVLIQSGTDPAGIFYVVEGRIIQYDISPAGNTIVVNTFKPNAFFPMSWAINKTPNDYFFEAATPVKTIIAPADQAVEMLKNNPDIMFDLLSRVYRGTDGVLRRMAHLMGGNARTRIIFELLNSARRFGDINKSGGVALKLTENDLAAYTGLARESISRGMKALKDQGLLKVGKQGIVIDSIEDLETALGRDL